MGKNENQYGTNDTWTTPPEVYEPIIKCLGPIRFDPFGNPKATLPAETRVLLPVYAGQLHQGIGIFGDAYDFDWSGRGLVFCNGPTSDCARWAHKMHSEEGGDENVSLWPVRTGSNWWQQWVAPSDAILFWRGRVKFAGAEHHAPWHSALSYVGPRGDLFVEGMRQHGWVVRNRRQW